MSLCVFGDFGRLIGRFIIVCIKRSSIMKSQIIPTLRSYAKGDYQVDYLCVDIL